MLNIKGLEFESSTEYRRMKNEIEYLKIALKGREKIIKDKDSIIQELLNEIEELKSNISIHKIKNERGAGRKSKFKNEDIELIKNLRNEGQSYKSIAKVMNCSAGLIHKLISENKKG